MTDLTHDDLTEAAEEALTRPSDSAWFDDRLFTTYGLIVRLDDESEKGGHMLCTACIDHPGWATPDLLKRSHGDICRHCWGSGTEPTHFPTAYVHTEREART